MLDGKELIGKSTVYFKTRFLKSKSWEISHAETTAVSEELKSVVQQKYLIG